MKVSVGRLFIGLSALTLLGFDSNSIPGLALKNLLLLVVVVLVSSEILPRKPCRAYPIHAWTLLPLRAQRNMMYDRS